MTKKRQKHFAKYKMYFLGEKTGRIHYYQHTENFVPNMNQDIQKVSKTKTTKGRNYIE